ncbi:AraC family transcriptional regulator [Christensenellaceae bacterium OttesenSCG-928-K19]|nr:AraC family transcriptional regulator [Christensenellaceae bacterium OttesenSCG-928-K19]
MAIVKQAIVVNKDLRELESHGNPAFPLEVYIDELERFSQRKVPWHWHPEFEFGVMLKGSMVLGVPEKRFTLHEGEGFFASSNTLHEFLPNEKGTSLFTILFSPQLLYGFPGSVIERKYITPLTSNPKFSELIFDGTRAWHAGITTTLNKVYDLCEKRQDGYELESVSELIRLWLSIYRECQSGLPPEGNTLRERDDERIKKMLEYIHASYADSLSLEDISGAANISTSECCRCFKRILKTTPFGYLNQYRLTLAAKLLRKGFSATHAFKETGFCSQSYFGLQFKAAYGCTPGQYKKANQES